jgi:hypothetical protein
MARQNLMDACVASALLDVENTREHSRHTPPVERTALDIIASVGAGTESFALCRHRTAWCAPRVSRSQQRRVHPIGVRVSKPDARDLIGDRSALRRARDPVCAVPTAAVVAPDTAAIDAAGAPIFAVRNTQVQLKSSTGAPRRFARTQIRKTVNDDTGRSHRSHDSMQARVAITDAPWIVSTTCIAQISGAGHACSVA